jgi:hypothetical protein
VFSPSDHVASLEERVEGLPLDGREVRDVQGLQSRDHLQHDTHHNTSAITVPTTVLPQPIPAL